MFAATSPTCSLEIPETVIFRLPSTVKVIPSGGLDSHGVGEAEGQFDALSLGGDAVTGATISSCLE